MNQFLNILIEAIKKHLNYQSELDRKQYTYFCLSLALIAILLSLLNPLAWVLFFWASFPFFFIFSLQRLNNIGLNRWWITLGIIPVVGLLFFIYTLIAKPKKPV